MSMDAKTQRKLARELAATADLKARNHVADLLPGDFPGDPPEAAESGLVQQQRWFAMIRRKLEEQR